MSEELEWIEGGSVTSAGGFVAGSTYAGIKTYGPEPRLDVGILAASSRCAAAGVFTRNKVCGAPVKLSRAHLADGHARAIVVNSGCSNVAMGERGDRDALQMAAEAARKLGVQPADVLVGSTGVIGRPLPMEKLVPAIGAIELRADGGADFARAIMTTDTRPKARAVRVRAAGRTYTVGGVAKGSGMVHPDMATVFCFLTTDAPAEPAWLQQTLREVADVSINMVDVDMDTSTSDTMLLLASGAAGGEPLRAGHPAEAALRRALEAVSVELARELARDGEGARTLITVQVDGGKSASDARAAARTVVSSPLVKTMVTGRDPNLGRVMAALGRSGAELDISRISVWIGAHCAFERGAATTLDYATISRAMDAPEVTIRVDLGLGNHGATAWGCDLTEDYVKINADYTT